MINFDFGLINEWHDDECSNEVDLNVYTENGRSLFCLDVVISDSFFVFQFVVFGFGLFMNIYNDDDVF